MAALTQTQIDAFVAKIQLYKYTASFGEELLGPMSAPPTITPEIEYADVVIYEAGVEVIQRKIVKYNLKISFQLLDVDKAMSLLATYKLGDNVLDSSLSDELILSPLTSDEDAKVLKFSNAYIQPDGEYAPGEGTTPNQVTLNFEAKPDATTGKPYTYA